MPPTFGAFEVNLRVGELRKHGLRLKLQDQPLRILTLLVKNAGEPVSREQIQANLWASDTHVDYENAINSAVRKLRDALGDTAENPTVWGQLSQIRSGHTGTDDGAHGCRTASFR